MRNLSHDLGVLVGVLALGCGSADGRDGPGEASPLVNVAELSETEKVELIASRMGWDATTLVPVENGYVVEGDILLLHHQLDAVIESLAMRHSGRPDLRESAYLCPEGLPGEDGAECDLTLNDVVWPVERVALDIGSSVPNDWARAFRRAAYVWSSSYLDDAGTQIRIDAEDKGSPAWTIDLVGVESGIVAVASWPWRAVFVRPGSLINVSVLYPDMPQSQKDAIALHELGHTIGFGHPLQGDHVPGTDQWTTGSGSTQCTNVSNNYETVMCLGNNERTFLSDDDILGAQTLYPLGAQFDLTAWSWSFCSADLPCNVGEGDCDSDAECAGYLVCLKTSDAVDLYGAPSTGDVCAPPPTSMNDGGGSCSTSFTTSRCINSACPCGVGMGDCDEDQECGGGLVCNHNNGAAAGQPESWDLCVHPRPPGCDAMDKGDLDWSLCTPSCPCSLGEGDCDTDNDCIGELVCGQNVGASFGVTSSFDLCIRPEIEGTL